MNVELSPGLVARAIVASARVYGDDPATVFSQVQRRSRRALAPSVVALAWATGRSRNSLCGLLSLSSGTVSTAETLATPVFRDAVEAAKLACLVGAPPPAAPQVDQLLLTAVLDDCDVADCAARVRLPETIARTRMLEIGRAFAKALGAGLMDPASLSGRPDRLAPMPTPPAEVMEIIAEGAAVLIGAEAAPQVAAPPAQLALPAPDGCCEVECDQSILMGYCSKAPPSVEAQPLWSSVAERDALIDAQLAAGALNRAIAESLGVTIGVVAGRRQRAKAALVCGGAAAAATPAARPARRTSTSPKGVFAAFGEAPAAAPAPRPRVSDGDRALIEQAVAAGKVRPVDPDGTTELVYDPDRNTLARLPCAELEFEPEHGWRKPRRHQRRSAKGGSAKPVQQ